MKWSFTKMQGTGNDFVVLDGVRQVIDLTPARARAIAHRQFGVGCDQILIVEPPNHPQADFKYRIFNADGSEVEHCGNGARCFVRFVHDSGLSSRNPLCAEIATGLITLYAQSDGQVTVQMGQTRFEPECLRFDAQGLATRQVGQDTLYGLNLNLKLSDDFSASGSNSEHSNGQTPCWISLVSISNPHAVQVVSDIATAPVSELGPLIESHPRFANRVNAGFMEIVNRQQIRLRVYERGAGETFACGTGACAAVVSGIRQDLLDSPVRVQTHGGGLTIAWDGDTLTMTGPAVRVFEGILDIDALANPRPTL